MMSAVLLFGIGLRTTYERQCAVMTEEAALNFR